MQECPIQCYYKGFGLRENGQGFVAVVDFQPHLVSLLLRWKTANIIFVVLSLTFRSGGIHLWLPTHVFA